MITRGGVISPYSTTQHVGQGLETIFARRLSDQRKLTIFLHPQKMAAGKNRSTETALEIVVESIHTDYGIVIEQT